MFNFHKDIKKFLMEVNAHPVGQEAQRIEVMSCFINGILKKGTSDLHEIARQMPMERTPPQGEGMIKTQFETRVKQLTTWLDYAGNSWYTRYLPCFKHVLSHIALSNSELVFVIDGSEVGNGCTALMISVVCQNRSIPVCWVVRQVKKGHLPESMHLEALKILRSVLITHPALTNKRIVLLGDGEFDGGQLTQACKDWGWLFVVRTAHNILIQDEQEEFPFSQLQDISQDNDGHLWAFLTHILYTNQGFGYVNALFWKDKNYKDPLYLLTNFDGAFDAYLYYKKRFAIETLFGDIKSRGFNVHKSKLGDPNSIKRLLICVCLAFIFTWFTALAQNAQKIKPLVTPKHKNDLSVFKFGRCVWDFCLNNHIPIVLSMSMNFVILLI
jgi:Transposase DDE domain